MKWDTAHDRCIAYGKDLCVYENVNTIPSNNNFREGYHWTNKDCGINVKINSEGYIAIVHDAMSTYEDNIPYLIEQDNTLNWFRVFWDGDGSYPGDNVTTNSCAMNSCRTMPDGSCLCKTTIAESVVFNDLVGLTKSDVMSQLFIGAFGPGDGEENPVADGLKAYVVGGTVDSSTIFRVEDKGRVMYFKNVRETVTLDGWSTEEALILEAEGATITNAEVRNNTNSATQGEYVYSRDGNTSTSIEWNVNVATTGPYLISIRYAHDDSNYNHKPWNVFVNAQEIERQSGYNPNPIIPFDNTAGNDPQNSNPDVQLGRCSGDCDSSSHCAPGLYCAQFDALEEGHPGCTGTRNSGWDFCLDPADMGSGFVLLPTGGWDDDWHYSEPLTVNLIAGANTVRIEQFHVGRRRTHSNIDHLKVEGVPASTSTSSFRNPPTFMGLIPEKDGKTELNLRDAQYETEAVLDHYFYQDNTAPFLCVRVMQRFSFSNPSPRFVKSCVDAFRTGTYTSGLETFGNGDYGSLEAMAASIFLDREATDGAAVSDPSAGSIREPILKVLHLMRSMEYQTEIPVRPGTPMQADYNVRLWRMDDKIGQAPYEFPTVFSYFLPEYVPDSGPNLPAQLTSPESMLLTMPDIIALLNGMISLIKYGLGDCKDGFAEYPGYGGCDDNGQYQRSIGHLFYEPMGATDTERATNLALLLTAGRLGTDDINTIVSSCSTEPDTPSKTRCMQQLIVTTSAFHSTSTVTSSGEDRITETSGGTSTEPYKAIVYFYLSGGLDSYNMLAPHTCAPIDVYDRYRKIRGKSELSEGVGLPLSRLLSINANNPEQPCSSFGIHENLPELRDLYNDGKLKFVANAGLMAKPVTTADYRGETPVQLFAHNAMTLEASREDLFDEYAGSGVGGRMADILTNASIPTNVFSIDGQQVFLTGEAGQGGPSQFSVSEGGLSTFNSNPSIANMNDVIKALNNDTTAESGFYGETWSAKLSEALAKQEQLKTEVDKVSATTTFPDGSTASEFEMITRIMQTRDARNVKRDIFYLSDGGYDTHSNVDANLINNFSRINAAIAAFVAELKVLGLWESTVVVQFSEFARTLDPNTGDGTDHAWGGQHFIFGGALNGGEVLGLYPEDFEQNDEANLALSRGRMIPTSPWDLMWKPVAEWFGIPANGPAMKKVLPLHENFANLPGKDDFFNPAAPAPAAPIPAPAPDKLPNIEDANIFT
jgi:uncharacterized protein (DUF1501 family)